MGRFVVIFLHIFYTGLTEERTLINTAKTTSFNLYWARTELSRSRKFSGDRFVTVQDTISRFPACEDIDDVIFVPFNCLTKQKMFVQFKEAVGRYFSIFYLLCLIWIICFRFECSVPVEYCYNYLPRVNKGNIYIFFIKGIKVSSNHLTSKNNGLVLLLMTTLMH